MVLRESRPSLNAADLLSTSGSPDSPEQRRALDQLFSVTYEELRRLASAVKRGDPSVTLSPTALVNEAWLKLSKSPGFTAASRLHFKRIAARAMRQLLIEAARRRNANKRGGGADVTVAFDVAHFRMNRLRRRGITLCRFLLRSGSRDHRSLAKNSDHQACDCKTQQNCRSFQHFISRVRAGSPHSGHKRCHIVVGPLERGHPRNPRYL